MAFFQHFAPCHERGDRGAELVCRFPRQTHPYPVLLRTLERRKRKDHEQQKQRGNAELHVRIYRQPFQQARLTVTYIYCVGLAAARLRKVHLHGVAALAHLAGLLADKGQRVRTERGLDVARGEDFVLPVEHHDGNGRIAVHHFQHEVEVRVLVGGN